MCGIIGYLGKKNAAEEVYCGLERLEYRGYDSAGAAIMAADGKSVIFSFLAIFQVLQYAFLIFHVF